VPLRHRHLAPGDRHRGLDGHREPDDGPAAGGWDDPKPNEEVHPAAAGWDGPKRSMDAPGQPDWSASQPALPPVLQYPPIQHPTQQQPAPGQPAQQQPPVLEPPERQQPAPEQQWRQPDEAPPPAAARRTPGHPNSMGEPPEPGVPGFQTERDAPQKPVIVEPDPMRPTPEPGSTRRRDGR